MQQIVIYVPWGEIKTFIVSTAFPLSLHPPVSLISNYLNLLLLNLEKSTNKKWGTQKAFVPKKVP